MKIYMVEGYSLITGNQGIIDYVEAKNEAEAYDKFEKNNPECEANEILMEMDVTEEDIEKAKEISYKNFVDGNIEVCFEFNGMLIVNPWIDETGRFELTTEKAVEIYGLSNMLYIIFNNV